MTRDERYARTFVSHASSWMEANPPNRGINWTSSLEIALRSIAWTWALHLFANSRLVTPEFALRALKHLVAHGRHIESYLSHYFSPNTHLTGEALGLFYLGTAFPEFRRARVWREKALRILVEQLAVQVRSDGVYFEQTSYYHRYTADFYCHLVVLARLMGLALPDVVFDKLAQVMDHLMWITWPDGTSPLVGDDDGGQLIALGARGTCDFRGTLATGAALLGRPDWKYVAGEAAAETLWLIGPEGLARFDTLEAAPPRERSRAFADGGYFVMRNGWSRDSSYVLVDCGPHGVFTCGHAHADALAVEFASAGTPWLIYSGTYTYTGDGRLRDEFRTTAAHNTVVVDGEPQSIPGGPFEWLRPARATAGTFVTGDECDFFQGSHDGYTRLADPVTHSRTVVFVKSVAGGSGCPYLVLRDVFAARGTHHYALRYHFPARSSARVSDGSVEVAMRDGRRLSVTVHADKRLRTAVVPGWISPAYGRREPAPVAVVEALGEGAQEFVSVLLPREASDRDFRVERQRTGCAGTSAFTVTRGEVVDLLMYCEGMGGDDCAPMRAVGSFAWGRFVRSKLLRLGLIGGARIEADGLEFSSAENGASCEMQYEADTVSLVVRGTSRFDLAVRGPVGTIVVNGTLFDGDHTRRRFSFADNGGRWEPAGTFDGSH
jgi:hypothetical protein